MSKTDKIWKNQLFYGDNLDILRRIEKDSVDLSYIDPPFNSKRNYNQIYMNVGQEDRAQAQAFVDTWSWSSRSNKEIDELVNNYRGLYTERTKNLINGLEKVLERNSLFAYLVSMTLRIAEIQRVLKPTGCFYLHCDPTASHYLKLICDSIFCPKGGDFINEIIWCYRGGGSSKTDFGKRHDVIFRYSKSKEYKFNADNIRIPYQAEGIGRTDDAMWGKHKGTDKVYKPNPLGKVPEDWWTMNILNANDPERQGYPTQKPERLLERIIQASTDEGDVVLDAYCGCGTTIAVAQRIKRKWIGIDITYHSISLILKRLSDSFGDKVLESITLSGVPKDFESAEALANKKDDRVRKEFEKWCVLTYSDNRAAINDKKGKDFGIDGTASISDRINGEIMQMPIIFSVKSDKHPKPSYIRDLIGVMAREKAVLGYFITLYPPTKDMIDEAHKQGEYKNELLGIEYSKVKIVTVQEILDGKQMRLPKSITTEVLKSAPKVEDSGNQMKLELE